MPRPFRPPHHRAQTLPLSWAAGPRKAAGGATARNIVGSVGYNAKIFGAGGTGFLVSWNRTLATAERGSDARAWGITVNQNFDAIGAKMTLVYRNYEYSNSQIAASHISIDDIDVFGLNTVFNF